MNILQGYNYLLSERLVPTRLLIILILIDNISPRNMFQMTCKHTC